MGYPLTFVSDAFIPKVIGSIVKYSYAGKSALHPTVFNLHAFRGHPVLSEWINISSYELTTETSDPLAFNLIDAGFLKLLSLNSYEQSTFL